MKRAQHTYNQRRKRSRCAPHVSKASAPRHIPECLGAAVSTCALSGDLGSERAYSMHSFAPESNLVAILASLAVVRRVQSHEPKSPTHLTYPVDERWTTWESKRTQGA